MRDFYAICGINEDVVRGAKYSLTEIQGPLERFPQRP
jgi:hypothetical protein